jgi:V8-like Glu-specific endopeptidase
LSIKVLIVISIVFIFNNVIFATSFDRGIYGDDNRIDIFKLKDRAKRELSYSVAAQMYDASLVTFGKNQHKIVSTTLEGAGVCSWERFADQMQASRCSGFLVAPDLIATAGHCIADFVECTRFKWVFGYSQKPDGGEIFINNSDIYSCKEVIEQKLNETTLEDYALIRLDRPVLNRKPLKYRLSGKISNKRELFVLGYPDHLPLKYADDASVINNSHSNYFITDLDTFSGNSGSPVFNMSTLEVEGILVRGGRDYILTMDGCWKPFVCKDVTNCKGEDVTRITEINYLMNKR